MGLYRGAVEDILFVPVRVSLLSSDAQTLQLRGSSVPAPVEVRLVLDSGSRRSTLTLSILQHLQCPPGQPVEVQTSTGEHRANYYEVGMDFLSGTLGALPHVSVVGTALPRRLRDYGGVIGRDILSGWELF